MNAKHFHSLLKNPKLAIVGILSIRVFKWMPDDLWLKIVYRCRTGLKLNLVNPTRFNEKLQWLKLHDRKSEYIRYVDKYGVRDHVAATIGSEHLIPLLGVWDNVDEIDFSKLPKKYVLKCTHDSGGLVIVDQDTDLRKMKDKIRKCLMKDYYARGREWPYKGVKPRIIAEKFMESEDTAIPLTDYKFMCFNGVPQMVFTCTNRTHMGCNVTFFDMEWNRLPFERHYKSDPNTVPKPKLFDEMVELSKKLSEGMPFVRVDLYTIGGQVYFGELTLYPGCGFEEFSPDEYDEKVGALLNLDEFK